MGQNGKTVPIQFFFSGDDDVWVYIDGELVLDVGGAHDRAAGLLEFGSDEQGQQHGHILGQRRQGQRPGLYSLRNKANRKR